MPVVDTRGSRDGTEVRPFPSPIAHEGGSSNGGGGIGYGFEQTAPQGQGQGQLPAYESVAGGSLSSPIKAARADSKVRSGA